MFQSGLGIYIETHRVTVAWVKSSFGRHTLDGCEAFPLNPGTADEDRIQEVASIIRRYQADRGIRSAGVFIGIPGETVMLRRIQFPIAVKESLRSTIAFEMEKYFPVSADQVVFDYQILAEEREAGTLDLLVAAARKNDMDWVYTLVKGLSSGVSGVDIGPSAVVTAVVHTAGLTGQTLVAFRGETGIQLCVSDNGKLLARRPVPDAASDRIPELAMQVLQTAGNADAPVALHTIGVQMSGEAAADWCEIPFPDPTSGCRGTYWEAYGLALKGVLSDSGLNLLPPRLRKQPSRLALYVLGALLVCVVVAGMGWAGLHLSRERAVMRQLDAEVVRLKQSVAGLSSLSASVETASDRLNTLTALYTRTPLITDILRELTQIIPTDAYLQELSVKGTDGRIKGVADSAAALITRIEESAMFRDASLLSPITRNGKKERFMIQFEISIDAADS